MSWRDRLDRALCRLSGGHLHFRSDAELADLKLRGCYVGEAAAWSVASHQLECLAAELDDLGYPVAAARASKLADTWSAQANVAARLGVSGANWPS